LRVDDQQSRTRALAEPTVITLPNEIDITNAPQVSHELAAAFAPGVSTVIVDMTPTTCCDSSGVRILALAHRQAAADHAELRVVAPAAAVLRIFELTGLDRLVAIYPTLDAARAAIGEPDGADHR
jgi:anti-sigma B factor antagonist